MNVTSRCGGPRGPTASAAPTAPTPPAANTSPSARAEPCRSFFTTYGRSTSVGPRKTRYASAAESSVPHSHTRRRTKRKPATSAASAGSPVSRARGGGHAADGRPAEPQGDRAHELIQRVRSRQVARRQEIRDDRVEGRREERT